MNSRQTSRSGYTLFEMLLVIAAFSVLLAVNAKWLHVTLKMSSTVKQRHRYHQNLQRLDGQLRTDIRQCRQMSVAGDELHLLGEQDHETVYTIETDQITLLRKQAGNVVFQDRFQLSRHVDSNWEIDQLPERVALIVRRKLPPNSSDTGEVDFFLRAGPNRWDR